MTDIDSDVATDTLKDLGPRKEERVAFALFGAVELLERRLADSIRFTSGARLVAANVVTGEEETIARQDLSWLDAEDVTDDDVVDGHELLVAVADDLDVAFFLLGAVREWATSSEAA